MHLFTSRSWAAAVLGGSLLAGLSGCACHTASCGVGGCGTPCATPCCGPGWGGGGLFGGAGLRSRAIPDRYPLGSVVREPFHVMQTNAEATDFVLYRNDFIGETVELTPDGKDHVMEIAARMRSAPFPVLVERSENNSNPQLDAERRLAVAQVLYDHGNSDADQRTFVSPAYARGLTDFEPRTEYYRHQSTRQGWATTSAVAGLAVGSAEVLVVDSGWVWRGRLWWRWVLLTTYLKTRLRWFRNPPMLGNRAGDRGFSDNL